MSLYLLDAWVAGSCSEIEDPIAFSDLGEIIFKCYPDVVVWFFVGPTQALGQTNVLGSLVFFLNPQDLCLSGMLLFCSEGSSR